MTQVIQLTCKLFITCHQLKIIIIKQTFTEAIYFMHLIQLSLDEVVTEWNGHRIRASHNTRVPAGIPDQLFFLPPSGKCFIIF